MADSALNTDYAGYANAAASIFARQSGRAAVDAFGLLDVFSEDLDLVDYSPAFAFLEAQGRQAATTPALAILALAASPLPIGVILDDELTFGLSFGRGTVVAVPDHSASTLIVVDRPGVGLVTIARPVEVPTQQPRPDDYVRLFDGSGPHADVLIPEADLAAFRPAMLARIRLGISAEILGACSRLLEDAIAYARTRRQFGHPIGDFQAVQHLLAWAATDLHQLRCLFDIAVVQAERDPDPVTAQAVKAMAGRVGHAVVQTAIQTTGAISFTWEYSLNRLHHRILVLDQLAGPSADLVAEIGRSVRLDSVVPEVFDLNVLAT